MTASGSTQNYLPGNAADGNPASYWESTDNAGPQWLTARLRSPQVVRSLVLRVPPSPLWLARTQVISVLASLSGRSWSTVLPQAGYYFNPADGNLVTVSLPPTRLRYLRLRFTANTDWPAGQLSELEIFTGARAASTQDIDLALDRPARASTEVNQNFAAADAVDANGNTFWASRAGRGWPQSVTVDLGSVRAVGQVVVELPMSGAWVARTQTLSVLGRLAGRGFAQLVASARYQFTPSANNSVTITLPPGTRERYLRLRFTANSAAPGGQVAEFQVFAP
jgi:hypothetical protein